MIQGVGNQEECLDQIKMGNTTQSLASKPRTRFSVSVYFCLMGVLICFSLASFSVVNFSKGFKKHKKIASEVNRKEVLEMENVEVQVEFEFDAKRKFKDLEFKEKRDISIYMFLTFLATFINYGYLPGVLSYSTLPYGIDYLYYSINISKFKEFLFFNLKNQDKKT